MINEKDMNKFKQRSSNIDFLRIVTMIMIIMYHIVRHVVKAQVLSPVVISGGANLYSQPIFYPRLLLLNTIMTFGETGNAIFMLISGYLLANRPPEKVKVDNIVKNLLLQLGFASITLTVVPALLHFLKPDSFTILPSITIFNDISWYVGYYLSIILIGRFFLNRFLASMTYREYATFLLILISVVSFTWFARVLDSLATGVITLITGVFLYSLGGFIRKFDFFNSIKTYVFILIPLLVYMLVWISGYNITETHISEFLRTGKQGAFDQQIPLFTNNSIVILLIGISIFELFRRLKLPYSKVITYVGKSAFMVYLIHDIQFFQEIWNRTNWVLTLSDNYISFVLELLKWAIITYMIGFVAYLIFNILVSLIRANKNFFIEPNIKIDK